jgi:hypothetical protein
MWEAVKDSLVSNSSKLEMLEFNANSFVADRKRIAKEHRAAPRAAVHPSLEVSNSVFSNTRCGLELLLLLAKVLPKADKCVSVALKQIPFSDPQDQEVLQQLLPQAAYVKHLGLEDCDLGDSGLALISEGLRTRGLVQLDLNGCGLSDASVPTIAEISRVQAALSTRSTKGDGGIPPPTLSTFELRRN